MDNQPLYKGSRKIIDSIIEGINKRIHKGTNESQEDPNKKLEYHIGELVKSLDNLVKNIKEKAGISEPEKYNAKMSLYYNNLVNSSRKSRYDSFTIDIFKEYEIIMCHLDIPHSPYKTICTNYGDKSFVLPDSLQNKRLIDGIKDSIIKILESELPMNINKPYINIRTDVSVYPYNPIKKDPEIIKYDNFIRFNNSRSEVVIILSNNNPNELY
jgi:hypothetical protein